MKWFRKEQDGHRHRWAPIEVKHGMIEVPDTGRSTSTPPGEAPGRDPGACATFVAGTQILLLCECGEYSTQTIHGHWEMAEVRRSRQGVDRELEELRKIAGL